MNIKAIKNTLIEILISAGHTAGYTKNELLVNGRRVPLYLDAERTGADRGWPGRPNGKFRLVVGGYPNRKTFPQTKDGAFKWEKVFDHILFCINEDKQKELKAKLDQEAMLEASVDVNALAYHFGLDKEGEPPGVILSATPEGIALRFRNTMTREQAEIILRAAQSAGLIS